MIIHIIQGHIKINIHSDRSQRMMLSEDALRHVQSVRDPNGSLERENLMVFLGFEKWEMWEILIR